MTDKQTDEALEAVGYLEAEAEVAPEVSSNNVVRLLPVIRQTLERQQEEIDALSRLNRALDEKLAGLEAPK